MCLNRWPSEICIWHCFPCDVGSYQHESPNLATSLHVSARCWDADTNVTMCNHSSTREPEYIIHYATHWWIVSVCLNWAGRLSLRDSLVASKLKRINDCRHIPRGHNIHPCPVSGIISDYSSCWHDTQWRVPQPLSHSISLMRYYCPTFMYAWHIQIIRHSTRFP